MDVAVTEDNVLVISHDPHLQDGALIRSLPLAALDLPTLDAVLDLAPGTPIQFNIEIKSFPDHPEYAPPPAVFSQLLLDAIRRHRLESRVIVQSFDFRILIEMRKLAPEIRLAALWEGRPRSFVEIAREAEAEIVAPEYHLVTESEVLAAHAAGLQVIPWTANHPSDWDPLIAASVDAIITDDPAALLQYLHRLGLH
jgi:glycerophosphoryl diester phosphodiesterase